jgi:hypothetical protein
MDKVVSLFFHVLLLPRTLWARRILTKQIVATFAAMGLNPVALTWEMVGVLVKRIPPLAHMQELSLDELFHMAVLFLFGSHPLGREAEINRIKTNFEENLQNLQTVIREIFQSEDPSEQLLLQLPKLLELRDGVRKAIADMDVALECAAKSPRLLHLVPSPTAA